MIIDNGDAVLVTHRRMFEKDETRYFVGRTIACEGPLMKVEGWSFVRDLSTGCVVKKDEKRTKVLSLSSPGYIVYQLSSDVRVDSLDIDSGKGDTVLVDGTRRVMNLSERAHSGHF